ncbi:carboxymuconolactone decarboxylase family protein [Thermodesulfobacteriota bacterium]
MSRISLLAREQLNDDQLKIYDELQSGERGRVGLGGPFNAWIRSPGMAGPAQKLGEFLRFNTSLESRLSELAIIMAGKHCRCAFEFASHAPKALAGGLDPAIVEAIRTGQQPMIEKPDEKAVYAFCNALLTTHNADDQTYEDLLKQVGEKGVMEVTALLGYYTMVSMTLNVFQTPFREGWEAPF